MTAILTWLFFPVVLYLLFYSFHWLGGILLGTFYRPEPKLRGRQNRCQPTELVFLLPAYKPGRNLIAVLEAIRKAAGTRTYIRTYVLLQEASPEIEQACQPLADFLRNKKFSDIPGNPYHHALIYVAKDLQRLGQEGKLNASHLILLDKDNLVAENFLDELEKGIRAGYDVVQGRRLPLAVRESSLQAIDALSEQLNDLMFRASRSLTGLMPEISGSGIAFRLDLFCQAALLFDRKAPGMDKNLMVNLLRFRAEGIFLPDAVLYEEKTSDAANMQAQRTRWLGAQYYIALNYATDLLGMAFSQGRFAPADYLLSLWRPPRSLQLLLTPVLLLAEGGFWWWQGYFAFHWPLAGIAALCNLLGVLVFTIHTRTFGLLLFAALRFPLFAIQNVQAALKGTSKKTQGTFIHTKHNE